MRTSSLVLALAAVVSSPAAAERAQLCTGDYADDMAALAPRARAFEAQPQAQYSYAIRNTATYECLSYAGDGSVRRARRKATLHGTGFGYRRVGNETLVMTNHHIAEWPAVTDDDHTVEGVPPGCKKVSEVLRIVDNENDAYEADDVALTRVVADPQLDIAILRAHAPLPILPWKIGRSSALHARNVVEVRGFPLGAFQATNVGKVISAYDHDDWRDWDHDDFIIDALLSQGGSGSPVLAVSCKTGEFELVGVYHAGYAHASALNVVVGIDQVRTLMTTLKRTPRSKDDGQVAQPGARERLRLAEAARTLTEPFFPFGPLPAVVRARSDGALVYEVFGRDFPVKAQPIVVIEDLPPQSSGSFGEIGRVWFGSAQGLKVWKRGELDAEAQAAITRLVDGLRHDALAAFAYRNAAREGHSSRERFERMTSLEHALSRTAASRRDLAQSVAELAERLSPRGSEKTASLNDALAAPVESTAESETAPAPGKRDARR